MGIGFISCNIICGFPVVVRRQCDLFFPCRAKKRNQGYYQYQQEGDVAHVLKQIDKSAATIL